MENQFEKIPSFSAFLEKKIPVSETATRFRFGFKPGLEFTFLPGQYVWLILDSLKYPDPRGERRAFSVISSNKDKTHVEFLVRNSDSGFKRTLMELQEGEQISLLGPFGHSFVLPEGNKNSITFITGGVAVAPLLGIINSLEKKPQFQIRLVHFVAKNSSSCNALQLSPKIKELGIEIYEREGLFSPEGMPTNTNFTKEQFYITGPQGFVNEVDAFLKKTKCPEANKHFEEYYPEPAGNLTLADMEKETSSIMTRALNDSKSHTIITDANGKILFANHTAEENTGYTFAEMSGQTPRLWGGIMPLDFYRGFWKKKHSISGFDGEITNHRKNGEMYTVLAHISPIVGAARQVIGYIGTEEDITLAKKQQRLLEVQNSDLQNSKKAMLNVLEDLRSEKLKLAEAKAKDESVLLSVADGLIVTDRAGKITLVNQAFGGLLGWEEKEVMGKYLTEIIPMLDSSGKKVPESNRLVTRALKDKSVATAFGEIQYKRKDQSLFPVAITVSPIILEGEVIGAVEVFRDMTKEREIDKAKTEFVSLASHQLRTPLTAINWYAEMLLAGDAGEINPEQKKFLDEIYTGNKRMIELVNALLNVSRIDLGTFAVDPEDTDIISLCRSVLSDLQSQILRRKQQVATEFSLKGTTFSVDPKLLRIIFQNIISNAVKYTGEKGNIKISLAQDRENIKFTVADDGCGIPKAQQTKIFTKLFRADNAMQIDNDGNGLGMYLTKSILEETGGNIWFESEQNKGTIFYVTIPITGMKKKSGSKPLES